MIYLIVLTVWKNGCIIGKTRVPLRKFQQNYYEVKMMNENKVPHITNSEWQVMQLLWDKSPSTAKELSATMSAKFGWAGNTTYTLIYRLLDKGAIRHEGQGHGKLYFNCVEEDVAASYEAKLLIDRAYRGDSFKLAYELAEKKEWSNEQKEQMIQMLQK